MAAIARALPDTWCVLIEPPHGQLRVLPLVDAPRHHRMFVASARWGAIRHMQCSGVR
jgi:hypothetical protein